MKRLLLAGHVACVLGDEMLVAEGAARAYNMLTPLLATKAKPPLILKALGNVHASLGTLTNLVQNSCVGQEVGRVAAARVVAAASYHALGLAGQEGEGGAVALIFRLQVRLSRSVRVALCCVFAVIKCMLV